MTFATPPTWIRLQGCRQHNLKNLTLSLPKYAITVLTGVSGSGKSSLALDTLFAEGQRLYLEYLSPQIRLLIKQMPKPEVEIIEGLSPTLAVGRNQGVLSSGGTVATYTDLYDFFSLLYANAGEQHSPSTGNKLTRYSRQEMVESILRDYPEGSKIQLLAPIKLEREHLSQALTRLQQMGFVRFRIQNNEWSDGEPLPSPALDQAINEAPASESKAFAPPLEVVVDRLELKATIRERLASSLEMALDLGQGILRIQEGRQGAIRYFTEIYVCPETGASFAPLKSADFNFNSLHGCCPMCRGMGGWNEVDPQLLFVNRKVVWDEEVESLLDHFPKKITEPFRTLVRLFAEKEGLKKGRPIERLPAPLVDRLLYGSSGALELKTGGECIRTAWQGLIPFMNRCLREGTPKKSWEELPFVEKLICPACGGARLKPESLSCLLNGKNIAQLCELTVEELIEELQQWPLSDQEAPLFKEILPAIHARLYFLQQVGLGYLELNRRGNTLSDGEAQRVRLASQIGAKLSGLIYVLDEPSLGLHRQDVHCLQEAIQTLKQLGNTVVMVEHERHLIGRADHVVELGPGAGRKGGHITFQGSYQELLRDKSSLTGEWLSGRKSLPRSPRRKPTRGWMQVKQASLHHLQNCSLKIPLGCLVGFCGVSGSGKSTLAIDLVGVSLQRHLYRGVPPKFLKGYEGIKRLVVREKSSGRLSSRSIPATYVHLMTPLRQLFAETRLAKSRGYTAARFSLNQRGGRCEACEGLGQRRVNMEWMPDIFIPCDVCQGLRYDYETLQATWENRSIADVLNMTLDEAASFFQSIPSLSSPLQLMHELGLGYLTLGQPSQTLSSGELQRLKLASDLLAKTSEPTLYILDEPSAGLHFEDIQKLCAILHRLVDKGHSVFIIEHHLDLLQQADWLIELGPGGGARGGRVIFEGTAAQLRRASTPTGRVLLDHDRS